MWIKVKWLVYAATIHSVPRFDCTVTKIIAVFNRRNLKIIWNISRQIQSITFLLLSTDVYYFLYPINQWSFFTCLTYIDGFLLMNLYISVAYVTDWTPCSMQRLSITFCLRKTIQYSESQFRITKHHQMVEWW